MIINTRTEGGGVDLFGQAIPRITLVCTYDAAASARESYRDFEYPQLVEDIGAELASEWAASAGWSV